MKRTRSACYDDDQNDVYRPMEIASEMEEEEPSNKKRRKELGFVPTPLMFHDVCSCLDDISKSSSKKRKEAIFRNFLVENRSRKIFPFIRLMAPKFDNLRGPFSFTPATAGKIYAKVFSLGDGVAKRLSDWSHTSNINQSFTINLWKALRFVGHPDNQENRRWENAISVKEMNEWLDSFLNLKDKSLISMTSAFDKIAHRLSILEHDYLIRIMSKALRIGLGGNSILSLLGPGAREKYNQRCDLEIICDELNFEVNMGVYESHGSGGFHLLPFCPFKPQLCSCPKDKPSLVARFFNSKGINEKIMVEPKFDGERSLIHYSRVNNEGDPGSARIEYYTRKGNNFTKKYSIADEEMKKALVNFKNCIIDGELLVYGEEKKALMDFPNNMSYATHRRPGEHFCMMAFDIVYVDGHQITDYPYTKRKEILLRLAVPNKTHFEVVVGKEVGSVEEIEKRLKEAVLDEGREGIILKKSQSKYVFDERKDWMKYKPWYVKKLQLLILGNFYGTKNGPGETVHISGFLCGLRVPQQQNNMIVPPPPTPDSQPTLITMDEQVIDDQTLYPCQFVTLTNVFNGFKFKIMQDLKDRLEGHWKRYNPRRLPSWFAGKPPPKANKKYSPRQLIDHPKNSIVLEIKVDSATKSSKFGTGHTLRFPRLVRVRDDLDYLSCWDVNEFNMFRKNSFEKQAHSNNNKYHQEKTGKVNQEMSIPSHFKMSVDPSKIPRVGNALKGHYFAVLRIDGTAPDYYYSKEKIVEIILEQGGKVSMNPIPGKTTAAISSHEFSTTRNIREKDLMDVILPTWIQQVNEQQRYVPLRREHLLVCSSRTEKEIAKRMDRNGDSYTEKITETDFKNFRNMFFPEEANEVYLEEGRKVVEETRRMVLEGEEGGNRRHLGISFFSGLLFYLDFYKHPGIIGSKIGYSSLEIVELQIHLHSGSVTHLVNKNDLRFIVMGEENTDRLEVIKKLLPRNRTVDVKVVRSSWIKECSEKGRMVDIERRHLIEEIGVH